ncbi:S1 family peptidase [Desulfatitalea tepidiphila]|uniref:S1 family peptidase n=1 Tax=Desulfatitalea tepidiphila TaxID=1185843 RepID=UPI0006B697ED|nr:serine protease [Desulfatitalea tepidiphila]
MNFTLRIFMLVLVLLNTPARADEKAAVNDFIVSIPMSEAEEVIRSWLSVNDIQLLHYVQNQGHRVIETRGQDRAWIIELSAHTPLATRLQVTGDASAQPLQISSLRSYLEGYVHRADAKEVTLDDAIPQAVKDLLPAIVCIYASGKERSVQLSGFCIDPGGLVATTAHDLVVGQSVRVLFSDGHGVSGRVLSLDASRDLCLIRVPKQLAAIIPLDKGRFAPGGSEPLYALGCPRGETGMIQVGALDGPPRRVDGFPLWQAHMHTEPGSSGSPVLDSRGRLTAVVKGRYRGTDAVGFLIPFETILQFLGKY